jgi:hypothetical protein
MKNQFRLVLALIAVLAITSCQKESSTKLKGCFLVAFISF